MRKLLFSLLVLPIAALAQEGIHFEHAASWKEVQAKAKAENKYIFMDAFTTWCGPCKYMSSKIFTQKDVGDFFNQKYINLKVQLDTTGADNEDVKKWYTDAHAIMTDYGVRVFPTYLFFSPDGKLVHRAVGASEAAAFIGKASDALDPNKQYYTLLRQYKDGKRDPAFLRQTAKAAAEAYDEKRMSEIGSLYLATQKDLFTKENVEFLDMFSNTTKDIGFKAILASPEKYDAVKGKGAASAKLVGIIQQEEVFPLFFKAGAATPDWTALGNRLETQYPAVSKEVLSLSQVMYYKVKKDWGNFQTAVVAYMQKYGSSANAMQLNDFAWTVFENCKDMKCLGDALEWSKRSLESNDPSYMDTYANILYKLGRKNEAIEWEERAIASSNNDPELATTLEKMKKGEKTWKD